MSLSTIRGYANLRIDDMNVIILTEKYSGTPLICYSPDMMIVPEWIFDKYNVDCFHMDYEKTKVIMI